MTGRFVVARSLDIKCANHDCRRSPEFIGEGGWLQFIDSTGGYHCPLCAQRYGMRWHRDRDDDFTITNLPSGQ